MQRKLYASDSNASYSVQPCKHVCAWYGTHEVLILSNQVVIVTPAFMILLIFHLIDYQRRNEIGFATSFCLGGCPFTFPPGVSK